NVYDLEVKTGEILKCRKNLKKMIKEKEEMGNVRFRELSALLYEELISKRRYTPEQNPELLVFEALNSIHYRSNAQTNQLTFLRDLLQNPQGIVQAGTGSGKSYFLSILRALKKANGENLVTYKVLPQLYQEMAHLMKTRLEKGMKRKVYLFQFDLKRSLEDRKTHHSIFIGIYQKMLETIRDRGCVLTDYKSLPLLEEKFWSLNRELLAAQVNGVAPTPLQMEHWTYLKKILILLQNREDQLMDEFDEPNRPVHRLQTQIQPGQPPARFMVNESMAIYEKLLLQPNLRLAANLQADISLEVRTRCIQAAAHQTAVEKAAEMHLDAEMVYRYIIGENEELLAHTGALGDAQKDTLAFLKDQFYTYLPLTLSYAGISKYQRSENGEKIIACTLGNPGQSKFGNVIEEINYSIQDYFQHGVAFPTARAFVIQAVADLHNHAAGASENFHEIIPDVPLEELGALAPEDLERRITDDLYARIKENPVATRRFLYEHLLRLRTSGLVVSMTPQDCVGMARMVSGMSATAGSLDSLHRQFIIDRDRANQVEEEMVERFRRRALNPTITYNPEDPLAVLQTSHTRIDVIIDGAGAYREHSSEDVARALLASNPILRKV
ncbi:MAG: DUF3638 domain-containing protein, partial [Chlamydiales bacterium]|nr:DUF3638 domain-containing protein [Chlamydiales bacterium]